MTDRCSDPRDLGERCRDCYGISTHAEWCRVEDPAYAREGE